MENGKFEIRDNFYLNGEKFKIISGAIHYFRVVPEYWRDRLEKLKAMGCNTVETYVAWNLHEPKHGEFHFDGMLDLAKFIKTAQELGLWVIVRPSPFICAEWEFGGLPAWLLAEDSIRFRTTHPAFLRYISEYYKQLFSILAPLQITNGGPIILFQIENEYGYYGDDKAYLQALADIMRGNGAVVPFVTSDGPWGDAIESGRLPGALPTGNFGSKAKEQFAALSKYTNGGPLMCMEFWVGWFDSWGCGEHHTSDLAQNVTDFDEILSQGSVNIYMFHGGTNFGFTSGSNYYDELTPDVTSYDYDAVLSEDGQFTEKYRAFQKVIARYAPVPDVKPSAKIERRAYGTLKAKEKVSLFAVAGDLAAPVESPFPLSMEKLGQNFGYTLYRSVLKSRFPVEKIRLYGANDRAQVFLDEKPVLTLYDRELLTEHPADWTHGGEAKFDILVENMGRVNFGPALDRQRKGIDGSVCVNGHTHAGWRMYALPLDNSDKIDFSKEYREGVPAFYRFTLDVETKGDTFLDMTGWGKGCVLLNGFNLGRFWEKGPQKRLYIPAPLLKEGENELIVFETEGRASGTVTLAGEPMLS